jgi:hypothetical protein
VQQELQEARVAVVTIEQEIRNKLVELAGESLVDCYAEIITDHADAAWY